MVTQARQTGAAAITGSNWVSWADSDYMGARALLLGGSVLQGSILSNTAIEKYLKGGLTVRGVEVRRIHNVVELYAALKNTGDVPVINEQYLGVLVKAYQLRYPDELEIGFNIALNQAKMLAELDATVSALRGRFKLIINGAKATTKLEAYLEVNDRRLLTANAAFGTVKREELFKDGSHSYELRVATPSGRIFELMYVTDAIPDDGIFDIEGLKQTSETQFEASRPPKQ